MTRKSPRTARAHKIIKIWTQIIVTACPKRSSAVKDKGEAHSNKLHKNQIANIIIPKMEKFNK